MERRFIQINLHRSGTARNLLEVTAEEIGAQILIISEPPRSRPDDDRQVTSDDKTCSLVLLRSAQGIIEKRGSGIG